MDCVDLRDCRLFLCGDRFTKGLSRATAGPLESLKGGRLASCGLRGFTRNLLKTAGWHVVACVELRDCRLFLCGDTITKGLHLICPAPYIDRSASRFSLFRSTRSEEIRPTPSSLPTESQCWRRAIRGELNMARSLLMVGGFAGSGRSPS